MYYCSSGQSLQGRSTPLIVSQTSNEGHTVAEFVYRSIGITRDPGTIRELSQEAGPKTVSPFGAPSPERLTIVSMSAMSVHFFPTLNQNFSWLKRCSHALSLSPKRFYGSSLLGTEWQAHSQLSSEADIITIQNRANS